MRIAVAGAGIGGLAATILLARGGHDITLIDQFEAPQPVGSGLMLQATGMAILSELGCLENIQALAQPIDRLFGIAEPSGRTVLDVRFAALRPSLLGLGLQRVMLFNRLYDLAVGTGCAVCFGTELSGHDPDTGTLLTESGQRLGPFNLVVDALGSRSPLSGRVGDPLPYGALWATVEARTSSLSPFTLSSLEQRYRAARQMVGVMGSGKADPSSPDTATFFWSLRGDAFADWQNSPLDDWKSDVMRLWPETEEFLDQITSHDDLTFARYRHRTHRRPVEGRLIHLGDSWHSTSPQLGQGANNALLDAYALARALSDDTSIVSALKAYEWMRLPHVYAYQTMSWAFTPVYQSDGRLIPWMRDWLAAPLSRIPPAPQLLAAIVSGAITSPLKRLGLRAVI